jgi:hypothetical protein
MGPPNEVTPSFRKTRKTSPGEPRTTLPPEPSAPELADKEASIELPFLHFRLSRLA